MERPDFFKLENVKKVKLHFQMKNIIIEFHD